MKHKVINKVRDKVRLWKTQFLKNVNLTIVIYITNVVGYILQREVFRLTYSRKTFT
jgi:hypothetical protein